ncbi:MAG TPA: AMP-binding protein [Acidimicrobiales bacterium]|nr:AMP-binding protein [Acidimicrobiales bacterium]
MGAARPVLVALDAAGPQFVDGLLAAWDSGDAVLPVDPRVPAVARARLLADMGAGRPVEDGDALVVATSGTTGRPKGVVLTHDAVRASALAVSRRLGVGPGDRWLACLPLAHVAGLAVVTRAVLTGTPLDVLAGFDAAAVAASTATLVSLVPTTLRRVDPTRFRVVLLGGAAAPSGLPPNVVTTWGMTETGSGVVHDGVPLDGVEVRTDTEGQLLVRGPMLLRCYRDGTDPKDADGWLPTGDVGEVGQDGRVSVHGRLDDLIVTGGENVWPHAVEGVLRAHPEVRDVAVVGRPDDEWGQRVVAVVVPDDPSRPPALESLRAWAREHLPAFAAPRELRLVGELPRTAAGKVERHALL